MREWRDVKGYEGLYKVSNDGIVKSVDRKTTGKRNRMIKGKELKQRDNIANYFIVDLCKDGIVEKGCRVHRLVADAFIPNPNNLPEVNHLDGDRKNNNVSNLEWCTHAANIKWAYSSGLIKPNTKVTKEQAEKIKEMYVPYKMSANKLAKKFGISMTTVYAILKGQRNYL